VDGMKNILQVLKFKKGVNSFFHCGFTLFSLVISKKIKIFVTLFDQTLNIHKEGMLYVHERES
jgi:hypothetical protein